jgi:hypothetical protein
MVEPHRYWLARYYGGAQDITSSGATIAAETAAPLPNLFCKAAGVLFPAEKSPTLSTIKFSPRSFHSRQVEEYVTARRLVYQNPRI